MGGEDDDNDEEYNDNSEDNDDNISSPDPFQGIDHVCCLGGQLAKHLLAPGEGNVVVSEIFESNFY